MIERRGEREREHERTLYPLVYSLNQPRVGQTKGWSQEHPLVSHVGAGVSSTWATTHCFPKHTSRELLCIRSTKQPVTEPGALA